MSKSLATIENLSVSLNSKEIIQGVTFSIEPGDMMAIIGPNGAGKTTLLRALLGIVPHQGKIIWSPEASIGYVPQYIHVTHHIPLLVQDFLSLGGTALQRKNKKLLKEKIYTATDAVGLSTNLLHDRLGTLSAGQLQKVLIAFALLPDPNILLFDEPTARLDPAGGHTIYELLHSIRDQKNISIVLVSHDIQVVYRYANKIICLNKEMVCYGPPRDINEHILKQLYGETAALYHHLH